jgi:dienelactone hydrolase
MRALYSAIIAALTMTITANAEDVASNQIAARVELHPISSLTISDQQFLTGDANGKQVTVTGEFRIAQGSGRLPVVVLIHGSGGMGPNIEYWAHEFNAMGISTFALDGFTGRGLTSVNTDQALMGFSRGGQATLFASLKRFHQMWNKSGTDFAVYIPFYPDCMTTYLSDTDVSDKPIRIFHGAPDDYNPVAPCKRFVERLRGAGRDVVLTEYPNVWHAFDNPLGSAVPVVVKGAQTVRNCQIAEEPKGVLINVASKQQFTYKDACVDRDPHVNHDAEATQAATNAVKGVLKTAFKLE